MADEIFTLDQIEAMPDAKLPDTFTLDELDAMEPRRINHTDIDLTSLVNVPDSLRESWKTEGKIGFAEAINRKSLLDSVPFAGSISAIGSLWKTKNAMDRIRSDNYGDNLEQRNLDVARVQNYLVNLEEKKTRGLSIGAQVGEGISELPAFALEFMLSGGMAKAGGTAAKEAVEKVIGDKIGEGIAQKVVTKGAELAAGAAARTATVGAPRILAGTEQRQIDAGIQPTEKGIELAQAIGEAPATSFMKAIGDVYIENFSEVTGAGLGKLAGGFASKVVPTRITDALTRLYQKIHPNDDIGKLLTKAGYNGFLEELGEERVGDLLRAVSGVEDFGAKNPSSMFDRIVSSVPSAEQMLVEAGVLSVPMLGFSAYRKIFNEAPKQAIAETPVEDEKLQEIANKIMADTGDVVLDETGKPAEINSKENAPVLEGDNIIENKKIYHGTDKIFDDFDVTKSADGTIWFTDNKSKIEKGEVSATGKGNIIERIIDENKLKLGGWEETDKYSTDELISQGYDGLKLVGEGETTYQIFNPEKLIKPEKLLQNKEAIDFYNESVKKNKVTEDTAPDKSFNIGNILESVKKSIGSKVNNVFISANKIAHIYKQRIKHADFIINNMDKILDTDEIYKNTSNTGEVRDDNSYFFVKRLHRNFVAVVEVKIGKDRNEIRTIMTKDSKELKKLEPFRVQAVKKEGAPVTPILDSDESLAARRLPALQSSDESITQGEPDVKSSQVESGIPSKTSEEKTAINKSTGVAKERQPKVYTEMQALKIGLRKQVRAAEKASVSMFKDMKSMLEGTVEQAKEQGKQAIKDMQAAKDEIVRMVKESLPLSERGKFLTMIADAKTLKDISKATSRIESIADQYERKAIIQEIKDTVKSAGKAKNIAIDYIKKIKDIVSQIDVVKRQASTIESLNKTQEYINEQRAKGEDVFLPERLLNQLRILSAKPIDKVETAQLLNLLSDIQTLVELGKTKLRVRGQVEALQKERDLNEIAQGSKSFDSETTTTKDLPGTKDSLGKKFNKAYAQASDNARKMNLNLMPMDVVFDMLDGAKGYVGANFRIFKARIDTAYSKWLNMQDEFKSPIHELANKLGLDSTDMQLIGIYAVREQEGGTQKLIATGYKESDIESVELNDKQMEFYNAMRKKLDALHPFIEETMRVVYNQPLGKVKNYFSFMTDFESMTDAERKDLYGDSVQEFGTGKRKNVSKGFTEKRVGGQQKIKVNAMEVFEKHVDNATYLVTMGKDIKYLGELAKTEKYRKAVGDLGQKIVVDWVDLLARKGTAQEVRLRWLDMARKNVGAATLGFKLSSALIQPTALLDGASLIDGYAFSGLNRILTDRTARQFVKDNMPEVRERIADDPSYLDYEKSGIFDKVKRAGFAPLKALDALTAAGVALGAYEKNLKDRGLEVDLNNIDKEALAYAQLIVRRTQSTGMFKDTPAVFNRGEALTGNISVNRAFLQFQSFVINRWSFIKHDMVALGIKNNDPKQAARIAFFMIMAAYAEAGLRKLTKDFIDLIVDGEFDDDDNDKSINEAAVLNMAQTVPFVGQAIGMLEYGAVPAPTLDAGISLIERAQALNESKRASTKEKNALLLGVAAVGYGAGLPGTTQALQLIKEKNK